MPLHLLTRRMRFRIRLLPTQLHVQRVMKFRLLQDREQRCLMHGRR